MKKVMLLFILTTLLFCANAQEKVYRNFEVKEAGNMVWVLPSDWRQAFSLVKQEWMDKGFCIDPDKDYRNDSLSCWLDIPLDRNPDVTEEKGIFWGCKSIEKLIPEALKQRLLGASDRFGEQESATYFSIYAVADRTGKIHTVYFRVNPLVLDLMHEDELQAICSAVKKNGIDVNHYYFGQHTPQSVKALLEYTGGKASRLDEPTIREATIKKLFYDARTPAEYGVVNCYGMSYISDNYQQELDSLRECPKFYIR